MNRNVAFFHLDRFVVQDTLSKTWIQSSYNEAEADRAALYLNDHEVKNGRVAKYDSLQVTDKEMAEFLRTNRSR